MKLLLLVLVAIYSVSCNSYVYTPNAHFATSTSSFREKDCWLGVEISPACRAAFPVYHFDVTTKSCRQTTYGGCRGTANNFNTIEECEHIAKRVCIPAVNKVVSTRTVTEEVEEVVESVPAGAGSLSSPVAVATSAYPLSYAGGYPTLSRPSVSYFRG